MMGLAKKLVIVAALAVLSTRAQAADLTISAADREAITAIVTPWDRSPASFAPVDWENAFGGRHSGFKDVQAFLTARVRPTMTDITLKMEELRLTPVTAEVIVADKYERVSGQTDKPGGRALPDRHVRDTYVLRRTPAGWEVVAERIADLRQ